MSTASDAFLNVDDLKRTNWFDFFLGLSVLTVLGTACLFFVRLFV